MSIEAMKQALEVLKSSRFTKVTEATELIEQAIAEAEKQEPFGEAIAHGVVRWNVAYPSVGTKLYTHPQPKREWVGLTPEDAIDIIWAYRGTESIVRATEAKLKEKNT